jgi:intein-encoded DNA endonuclease-like protein
LTIQGRISKILLYGYKEEINDLRNKGYSYQRIADTINKRHPENETITKDVVCRYYKGLTKKLGVPKVAEIIDANRDNFEDIANEIRRSSLPTNERRALLSFIRYRQRKLEENIKRYLVGKNIQPSTTFEATRRVLLEFSRALCVQCRKRVVDNLTKD